MLLCFWLGAAWSPIPRIVYPELAEEVHPATQPQLPTLTAAHLTIRLGGIHVPTSVPFAVFSRQIWCYRYYLRTFCDEARFGDLEVVDHVPFLQARAECSKQINSSHTACRSSARYAASPNTRLLPLLHCGLAAPASVATLSPQKHGVSSLATTQELLGQWRTELRRTASMPEAAARSELGLPTGAIPRSLHFTPHTAAQITLLQTVQYNSLNLGASTQPPLSLRMRP